ncbi:helicase [Enterococcus faecalis D32]|nr:helicase [Enterococcus faecalis D32]
MKSTRKIAVRQVVEFILRRGSIDSRHVSEHTPQEGSRLHRMLQKEAGSLYQKEVSLKIEVPLNGHNYCVEGRADGIFVKETGQVVIDEIKTSEPAFEELPPEKVELFWYQVMCYGHMYCQQEQLSEITLQLTYYQTTTKQITRQERHFTEAALAEFFTDLMKRYEQWVIFKEEWRILRNKSLKNLSFPYGEYRKGQRELAVAVYKTILSKQRLFVEAPTGTGKTMSTLFPAMKAICEEKDTDFFAQRAPIDSLVKQIHRLTEVIAEWLPENQHIEELASILSFYFDCLSYLRISEYYDNGFYTSISLRNYDCVVKQFCVDPAYLLSQRLDKGKASILFSASLTPLNYYQEVLGGGEESLRYRIPYPFPEENQLLMIGSHLQTTYKNREKSYPQISELLGKLSETKTGNYLIFFPSYAYMDDVYQVFSQCYPQVKTQIQGTDLNEKEREAFLAEFKENPQETFIGFCVLGGIFSEGIDLKGTRLIGTIIVSVGLPQMNPEQELIRTFYQEERGQGFQFAYQIPGMNKVLQAAGRVIRDARDKGFVLLLDERFELPSVQRFFPPHWLAHRKANTNEQLIQQVKQFWLKNKENKGGNK